MKPNIVLQAPVFSLSGYGSHARDIALALFEAKKYNISVLPTGWGGTSTTDNLPVDTHDTLVFMCNNRLQQGSEFTFIHVGIPPEFKKVGRFNIGITAGLEATGLPDAWVKGCNQMDLVIVPSTFMRELFVGCGVTSPVQVVGEGTDINVFNPTVECKLNLDLPTSFNFLGGGQWMSQPAGEDRKGIGLLIQLFCEQFADNQDVGLVLKTLTMNTSSPDFYHTKMRIEDIKRGKPFPKIYLIHGDMREDELAQLYRHPKIKAFVSLTSGEGWHRMAAEAAASNLPLIITGWSSHMDFVQKDKANIVSYELKEVPRSVIAGGFFEQGMQWAFPDPANAKRKMRLCYDGYSVALSRAKELGEIFRKNWNREATSKQLVAAIDAVVGNTSTIITNPQKIQMQSV